MKFKPVPEQETEKVEPRWRRTLRDILTIIVLFFVIRGTFAEAFVIPSSSMEPTLQIGDRVLVNKLSYGFRVAFVDTSLFLFDQPKSGDIVVFTQPDDPDTLYTNESDKNIIKRVIAVPGDTVEVKGTKILLNGKQLDEEGRRVVWLRQGIKDFGPVTVPDGEIFLLGDNRDNSRDSRFWDYPFIPLNRVKGRAFMIYWPIPSFL